MTCVLDDAERDQVMWPINTSDEQTPHHFFNIIICCTCNMCPRAVEQATQATMRENLDKASLKPVSSAKQAS